MDATAWANIENRQNLALFIHDHTPVADPQSDPFSLFEDFSC